MQFNSIWSVIFGLFGIITIIQINSIDGYSCPIMIRNVTVIDSTNVTSPYIRNQDVLFVRQTDASQTGNIVQVSNSLRSDGTLVPQTNPNVQEINGTNKFVIPALIDSSSTVWSTIQNSPSNDTLLQAALLGISSVVDVSPTSQMFSFDNHQSIRTGPLIIPQSLASTFPPSYTNGQISNNSLLFTVNSTSNQILTNIEKFNSIQIFLHPNYNFSSSEMTFLQNTITVNKAKNPDSFKVFIKCYSILDLISVLPIFKPDAVLGIPSDIYLLNPSNSSSSTTTTTSSLGSFSSVYK